MRVSLTSPLSSEETENESNTSCAYSDLVDQGIRLPKPHAALARVLPLRDFSGFSPIQIPSPLCPPAPPAALTYLCSSTMLRRRARLVVVLVVVAAIFAFLTSRFAVTHRRLPHLRAIGPADPRATSCTEQLGWLEPYKFSSPFEYVSRDIIVRPRNGATRALLTVMDEPLFEGSSWANLAESQTLNIERCLPPLELEVPHGAMVKVDASNMIFGLQTTIGRLRDTVQHLERWLPHTGARLYAIVIDPRDGKDAAADDNDMQALEKRMRDAGIEARVVHPPDPADSFAQRYFSIVKVLHDARDDKTQWMICIDDDTFFPSMNDLQNILKEHDHQKPQYLGSLSEDWWAVDHYGLMAFGGAGVLLSPPMVKIVMDHYDECKRRPRTTAGDVTLMDCIYRFSTTKLTHIPGLHQIDMHDDLSGFYESGREMLSVHHWKEGYGFTLEMEKMHLVADICDNCFLQRWQFPHGLVLSNGFSIASYPEAQLTLGGVSSVADTVDFGLMEKTWSDDIRVDHSLAPIRPALDKYQKVTYRLRDSVRVNGEEFGAPGAKVVRQIYVKDGSEADGRHSVMVLNWIGKPDQQDAGED